MCVALPPKSDRSALRHEHSERLRAMAGALQRAFGWIASDVLLADYGSRSGLARVGTAYLRQECGLPAG
jgi:hypothetical protein